MSRPLLTLIADVHEHANVISEDASSAHGCVRAGRRARTLAWLEAIRRRLDAAQTALAEARTAAEAMPPDP